MSNKYRGTPPGFRKMDEEVYKIYGLTEEEVKIVESDK